MPSPGPSLDRPVAAFDFDGTLSRRDTLVPFLIGVRGMPRFAAALAAATVDLCSAGRDAAKAALLRRLLGGLPSEDFDRRADEYGQRLVPRLRPDTVARLRWHQAEGHHTVIVSASLEDVLGRVGAELGVDAVLATRLERDVEGRLTGEIDGPNVRGAEKVVRLRTHMQGEHSELWAYGNSSGDIDLLAEADHPVWVRPRRRLATTSQR